MIIVVPKSLDTALIVYNRRIHMKKDWEVTLSYTMKHDYTYLIKNVSKEDAIYIAENQNQSPRYDCTLIKEDESYQEDEETSIKEVN